MKHFFSFVLKKKANPVYAMKKFPIWHTEENEVASKFWILRLKMFLRVISTFTSPTPSNIEQVWEFYRPAQRNTKTRKGSDEPQLRLEISCSVWN